MMDYGAVAMPPPIQKALGLATDAGREGAVENSPLKQGAGG